MTVAVQIFSLFFCLNTFRDSGKSTVDALESGSRGIKFLVKRLLISPLLKLYFLSIDK